MPKPKPIQQAATVGDLLAILATLPADMPMQRHGSGGNYPIGVMVCVKKLAKHRNPEDVYHGDMTDPMWKKIRHQFGDEFSGVIIDNL